MNSISKIIIITLALITSWGGQTLTGQINVSGIANAYYPVTAISGNTITVGTGQGATHAWATGQKALLIQMTGNTSGNAGKFEFLQISGVSGGNITVGNINRSYSPTTERVQLVWVPYDVSNITVTADVTALPWNGMVGGIISLVTPGTITLNGDINANGVGFSYSDYSNAISGSNIWYGGGSGGGYGFQGSGGGGGGHGEGGEGGVDVNWNNSQNGTYIGGSPIGAQYYGGNGGGGGGGVGGSGGGGASAGGGQGGGGAARTVAGCGGDPYGGEGSINGIGGTNGQGTTSGGGGGGLYVGGGGGKGANVGLSGNNGGTGGTVTSGFKGGDGGGISSPFHNYFYCDPITGVCSDPRAWMGGGAQSTVRGGGIIFVSANTIVSNGNSIIAEGDDGVLLSNVSGLGNHCGCGNGGSGGGGGGLVILNVKVVNGGTMLICVKGGDGATGEISTYVSGGSGGAGGGGAIWVYDPTNSGINVGVLPPAFNNISYCSDMGVPGGALISPKNGDVSGGGGCGSGNFVVWNPNDEIFEVPVVCNITLTATPTTCEASNNTYTVSGNLSFTDPPLTGTLTVSIGAVTQTFNAPFTSPQAYTLTGLTSDGASHTVTAAFSDDAACTATQTYTAPVSCQCVISNITATPGACSTTNNTYTLTGQVTFTNAPAAGTLVISVTGGNSVTLTAPFTSPMSYSIVFLNADGASHTVTAIFSNDILCTSTQTYTAPVQCSTPCPPSNFNFCTGDSYTLTAPAGYSGYQWYTVVGVTETPIPGAMSNVYVATMPGTYIYRATDAGACAIDLCCPVTLNNVSPLLSCTATVTPACGQSNGSATVTAVGGAGGYTYRWSTSPQQTSATATNLTTGIYTVTVTDSGGCSNTCNVNLAPPNSPTCVASVQSNPGCGLSNGSATVTPSGGNGIYTYAWSTSPTQTTQAAMGLGAGTYTVTVTDGNMCSSTCSVALTTPSGPTCSIVANTQPSCANLTGGSATASGVGGSGSYSYAWSNNMSGATVSGLAGGTYTVTITDSNNCSSTCQVTIATPQNCCNVNAVTIQNIACYDNNTPAKMTDNQIRAALLVTNSNASLTTYNVTVNGGTTITPTSGTYGIGTQFTLGPGTAGGGATFIVTITDSANPACQNTVQLVDPGNCTPAQPECPPVKCGTATIQVNGN